MSNIILLYREMIPSVILCGYEQLKYLSERGTLSFQHCQVRKITKQQIQWADVAIFVRSDSFYEERIAKIFKQKDKRIVYALDDDLLNVPEQLESYNFYNTAEVRKRIENLISLSDCLISPSKMILDMYGHLSGRKIRIEEPAVKSNSKDQKRNDSTKTKIGFAGTVDRSADIDLLLSGVIRSLKERYNEKIKFEFFGAKPNICTELGLTHYPYEESYGEYQKKMVELGWDIGLAPMPDTLFHNCKHYNKYLEYGAFGIVGVYSNVLPYTEAVRNGYNGILCNNSEKEWVESISMLIEDELLRKDIKSTIMKEIEGKFSISAVSEQFGKNLEEILSYKAPTKIASSLKLLKLEMLVLKSFKYVRKHGIRFPVELIRKVKKKLTK